jgi:hypothetical protein
MCASTIAEVDGKAPGVTHVIEGRCTKQLSRFSPLLPENEASAICFQVLCQQCSASPCLMSRKSVGD